MTLNEVGMKSCHLGMNKVLLIGGAGYIGTALCKKLRLIGYEVTVADIGLVKTPEVDSFLKNLGVRYLDFNLHNMDLFHEQLNACGHIVHLGGVVGDPACALDPLLTVSLNTEFTRLVLSALKEGSAQRFVFLSSCSVYGVAEEVVSEVSDPNPISLYAETKLESEQDVLRTCSQKKVYATVLRLSTVYGLNPIKMRYDLVSNLFAAQSALGMEMSVYNGSSLRPFVHVRDVARSISMVMAGGLSAVDQEIFNVGDNTENYSINDLATYASDLNPAVEFRICEDESRGDRRSYKVDFSKIKERLGFQASVRVREGLAEVFNDAKARKLTSDALSHPRFNNLAATKVFLESPRSVLDAYYF